MGKMLEKAIIFANEKHRGAVRKGENQPYIYHPLEVLGIASILTNDEDILCAAVLHDTVEDTDCTKEEIEKNFNKRIAELVAEESENKREGQDKIQTWEIRKKETIDLMKNTKDIGPKIICLGDKISNLRSFNRLILMNEATAWDNFNMKDPKMHFWYYNGLRDALSELENTGPYKEYCFLVDSIFDRYLEDYMHGK